MDDILLIGNDIELLNSVKGYLNSSFSMNVNCIRITVLPKYLSHSARVS